MAACRSGRCHVPRFQCLKIPFKDTTQKPKFERKFKVKKYRTHSEFTIADEIRIRKIGFYHLYERNRAAVLYEFYRDKSIPLEPIWYYLTQLSSYRYDQHDVHKLTQTECRALEEAYWHMKKKQGNIAEDTVRGYTLTHNRITNTFNFRHNPVARKQNQWRTVHRSIPC